MFLHLPGGRSPDIVRDTLIATMQVLPAQFARSVTWVQGTGRSRGRRPRVGTEFTVELRADLQSEDSACRGWQAVGVELSSRRAKFPRAGQPAVTWCRLGRQWAHLPNKR